MAGSSKNLAAEGGRGIYDGAVDTVEGTVGIVGDVGDIIRGFGAVDSTGPGAAPVYAGPSEIRMDPALKPRVVGFYEDMRGASESIGAYVESHTRLDGSYGLLLGWLKPRYDAARATSTDALVGLTSLIETLGGQFEAAVADLQDYDDEVRVIYESMQPEAGGYGGGHGGGSGGYSGGSGGYSPAPAPAPVAAPVAAPAPAPAPAAPAPAVEPEQPSRLSISVEVGADGEVDVDVEVAGGADVDGDIDVDVEAPPAPEAQAETEPDPLPELIPASFTPEDYEHLLTTEERYRAVWEQLAAEDPLGRSPEELRLAFEERDALPAEPFVPGGEPTLGYGPAVVEAEPLPALGLLDPSGAGTSEEASA